MEVAQPVMEPVSLLLLLVFDLQITVLSSPPGPGGCSSWKDPPSGVSNAVRASESR